MQDIGLKNPKENLESIGIKKYKKAYWNLSPEELSEHSIKKDIAVLADKGALVVMTGKFTGRSPLDRFIVKDKKTAKTVDWNDINMPISTKHYKQLYKKITKFFKGREVYVKDAYVCADENFHMNLRLISELPWSGQFANNMFLRLNAPEVKTFTPEWTIIAAPGCIGNPEKDGIRQDNFAVINFTEKKIIIGGSGYTGEIKKGVFSVLNYVLPHEKDVLSMHCSANIGKNGDVAIFFGLSGTGKTTLSAVHNRALIGDDEHGWSEEGVFNFEGGCYAKCIDLSEEKEPQIYHAIKHGAILENIKFYPGTRTPDFTNSDITENTRVSYPLYVVENAHIPSIGGHPKNVFFLTADAFGVLPPISRLTPGQAMYHFISGYTAKVAGTEEGIVEPQTTFSACFGAPFMPLHPTKYGEMLGERMHLHNSNVWLVNTGWTGGAYGVGERIKLKYTREMVNAAIRGDLDDAEYEIHDVFGLAMPKCCAGVPKEVLNPRNTWKDKAAYDEKAQVLAKAFVENFKQFEKNANDEIMAAAPKVK